MDLFVHIWIYSTSNISTFYDGLLYITVMILQCTFVAMSWVNICTILVWMHFSSFLLRFFFFFGRVGEYLWTDSKSDMKNVSSICSCLLLVLWYYYWMNFCKRAMALALAYHCLLLPIFVKPLFGRHFHQLLLILAEVCLCITLNLCYK